MSLLTIATVGFLLFLVLFLAYVVFAGAYWTILNGPVIEDDQRRTNLVALIVVSGMLVLGMVLLGAHLVASALRVGG